MSIRARKALHRLHEAGHHCGPPRSTRGAILGFLYRSHWAGHHCGAYGIRSQRRSFDPSPAPRSQSPLRLRLVDDDSGVAASHHRPTKPVTIAATATRTSSGSTRNSLTDSTEPVTIAETSMRSSTTAAGPVAVAAFATTSGRSAARRPHRLCGPGHDWGP